MCTWIRSMFCVESSYASGCRLVLCRNVLQSCTSFVSFRCSSVSYVVGPCILDCWLRGWVCASGCKDSQGLIVPNFLRRSTCNQTLEDEVRFLPNTGFTLWLDCCIDVGKEDIWKRAEGALCVLCCTMLTIQNLPSGHGLPFLRRVMYCTFFIPVMASSHSPC